MRFLVAVFALVALALTACANPPALALVRVRPVIRPIVIRPVVQQFRAFHYVAPIQQIYAPPVQQIVQQVVQPDYCAPQQLTLPIQDDYCQGQPQAIVLRQSTYSPFVQQFRSYSRYGLVLRQRLIFGGY